MPVQINGNIATLRPPIGEQVHSDGIQFMRLEDGSLKVTVLWNPDKKYWRTPLSKKDVDRLAQWLSDQRHNPGRGQFDQPETAGQHRDVVSVWNDTGDGQVSFWKREDGGLWVSLMAAGLRRGEVHMNGEASAIFTKWLGEPPT